MVNARIALTTAAIVIAGPALGQDALDLGALEETLTGRSVQLLAIVTVLSLVPGLAITVTCFPFIVTVLSILRQAIGLQQAPPNMLIVSLALFLSWYVMDPVLQDAWAAGAGPLSRGEMSIEEAVPAIAAPFRTFMEARVAPDTLDALRELRDVTAEETPYSVLVPSFLLSEIARAFQIGFLLFLPFLVIDLVVAAVLMSMGMMMVPPAIIALPFKLAFFVVANGWTLVATSLVRGYGGG